MMVIKIFTKFSIFCVILNVTLLSFVFQLYSHKSFMSSQAERSLNLKYILLWTRTTEPIMSLREGTETFIHRRCSVTNCYVSTNKWLLEDVSDFDVILFEGKLLSTDASRLPQSRSSHQKYIFSNMESSANYPICDKMYNSYFNWTWTYKLNSDEYFGYISIRDKEGKIVGPKEEMHWVKMEAMMPINDTLKAKLSTKKIAVAWFVSNCYPESKRNLIAERFEMALAQYGLQLDIFGKCGTKKCPRDSMKKCLQKLETDYYFYLSFENSLADDYVTEKLLNALNHYTVPVVYGSANYTRFMPPGAYLTVRFGRMWIRRLAKEMADIIKDKQKYYKFFKWHNHYTYHELSEFRDTDPYCKLCALVNNQEKYTRTSVYEDFVHWWSPSKCRHRNRLLNPEK